MPFHQEKEHGHIHKRKRGNIAFTVPADTAGDSVLAIRLEMFGDKVYVAVK